jgi:hypothetical protein
LGYLHCLHHLEFCMNITRETIDKIHALLNQGLVKGLGQPEPGKMCVEAAINYALGRPHGDDPGCVSPALRRLKIRLNDANWSSNKARAEGMRRLAIAQLGSKDVLDETLFARKCALAVAHLWKMPTVVRQYLETGDETLGQQARDAAAAAAAATYADAAAYAAAYGAAYAAAAAAAYAARAAAADAYAAHAAHAAYAAAGAAAAAAADAADADAADAAKSDKALSDFAERIVQILIDMKAPGVQWL